MLFRQVFGFYGKGLSVGKVQCDFGQLWSTEYVLSAYGVNGVESHSREHVPCRHLTAVVIAAKSVGQWAILGVEYFAYQLLGALWRPAKAYRYAT